MKIGGWGGCDRRKEGGREKEERDTKREKKRGTKRVSEREGGARSVEDEADEVTG